MTSTAQRGYDDTGYLQEMAKGLIVRTWGSVDEAAKAVLGEEAGSNVDRLRRKFREQNWYERGLTDHVEAEIRRRGLTKVPAWLMAARRVREACLAPFQTAEAAGAALRRRFLAEPPKGSLLVVSVGTTLLFSAAAAGAVAMQDAMAVVVGSTLLISGVWADRASAGTEARTACLHLAALAALTAAVVAAFALVSPSELWTFGSSQGTLAAAAGMTLMGVYATSYVGTRTRRSGTRSTIEVASLIAAIAALSQAGTAVMIRDVAGML